ncbi:MAG TPA: LysR substrate-binding domain-containing protein [Burkholderiales bacterium]|jgi:Transcriptional regulator
MTLKQLLLLREVARQSLNMSKAATALHTSQPGISRQIQLLERELGVPILARRKNRTLGYTDIGKSILEAAQRLLNEADSIKAMAAEARGDRGRLAIVTTHLHARYTLLEPVSAFIARYPDVQLHLMEVETDNIPRLLESNEADIGISTEMLAEHPTLTLLRGHTVKRSLIMPRGHPLARKKQLKLADICRYPLLGYSHRSRTGQIISEAFEAQGIQPRYLISVGDSDVVKAYVGKGLGIAVLPAMAVEEEVDTHIQTRDVTALFPRSAMTVSFRRNAYLRRYAVDFIRMVPGVNREDVKGLA